MADTDWRERETIKGGGQADIGLSTINSTRRLNEKLC